MPFDLVGRFQTRQWWTRALFWLSRAHAVQPSVGAARARLPFAPDSARGAAITPEQRIPGRPQLTTLRVLVADDTPIHQVQTCELLASFGITPVLAKDGEEVVRLACTHAFDLILMDLQMPVLDGMAATTQIRRHEQSHSRARVPVLAYTTLALGHSAPFLHKFDMDGALEKPASAAMLREALVRWCPASGHDSPTCN